MRIVLLLLVVTLTSCTSVFRADFPKNSLSVLSKGWFFKKKSEDILNPVRVPGSLNRIFPKATERCDGSYITTIEVPQSLIAKKEQAFQLGILIPFVGGLSKAIVGGKEYLLVKRDHSSTGTVVAFQESQIVDGKIELEIQIEGIQSNYCGIWFDAPILGSVSNLLLINDRIFLHQKVIPLFHSFSFIIIGLAFLLILYVTGSKFPVYREFVFTLFSWAVFYYFLSGEVRDINASLGSKLHLPARVIAGLSLFRLYATLADIQARIIHRITVTFLVAAAVQTIAEYLYLHNTSIVIYMLANFLTAFATVFLFRKQGTFAEYVLRAFAVIAGIGFVSDAIKFGEYVFDYSFL